MNEKAILIKEIHKTPIKHFQTQHVTAYFKNDLFSADLVDYSILSKQNKGIKFLLTVIDIYSRYVWVLPLKNKQSITVLDSFKSINEIPKNLFVDRGTEFYNKDFKAFNKINNINMYSTFSEIGGGHIERFNRTLKTNIAKYMDYESTKNYINELPKIVELYNNTKHSVTKQTPYNIYYKNAIPDYAKVIEAKEPKYKVGDYVRISKNKRLFEKGYTSKFTKEVYKIVSLKFPPYPIVYELEDLSGEKIEGWFYEQ